MNDKLNDAMNQIGDLHLYESIRPRRRRLHWITILVVVILALALLLYPIIRDHLQSKTPDVENADAFSFAEPVCNDPNENTGLWNMILPL